jgi:hypothetical protein
VSDTGILGSELGPGKTRAGTNYGTRYWSAISPDIVFPESSAILLLKARQ